MHKLPNLSKGKFQYLLLNIKNYAKMGVKILNIYDTNKLVPTV